MPNWSVPPPLSSIRNIPFPPHAERKLLGQIPMVQLHSENYEVVKVEFVFNAGRVYEKQPLVSKATNMLLKAGTSKWTSAEINEHIDFYGATIGLPINFDYGAVVLYCMSKDVAELLPFVMHLITESVFPESELDFFIQQQKGKLQVALENADTVAFRTITEHIFGSDHPYGYNSWPKDYDALTREAIIEHHRRLYTASNCRIFVSGNLHETDLELLEQVTQQLPKGALTAFKSLSISPSKSNEVHLPMDDKVQVAIRIGRRMFNRQHEDFQEVYLFGVLLGGYFGSRLSMSIREEKGYTYGIHTTLDAMVHDGCFLIATEVAQEYKQLTLDAIYEEIADLRTNEVSNEELQQMKSYLQGYLMNSVDGVFRSSTVLRGLRESGVGESYFESLQKVLERLQPKDIKRIAQKYFKREDLIEVVVG